MRNFGKPHYVREYKNLVSLLLKKSATPQEAFERAVGGNYRAQGKAQAALVKDVAPSVAFTLIDVGCGSGRLAYALREDQLIAYHGVDVVPELIDYAREVCQRDDWRFDVISSIAIPAADQSADVVVFMSVFTHLKPQEIQRYLREAARVLKPGGVMVASYLDRTKAGHIAQFRPPWRQRLARIFSRDVMITHTESKELGAYINAAGLEIEREITENSPVGQFVIFGRKPLPATPSQDPTLLQD